MRIIYIVHHTIALLAVIGACRKKKENSELSYSSVLVTKQWLLFNEGYKSEGGFNRTMKVRYDFLIFSDYLPLRYLLKIGFKT